MYVHWGLSFRLMCTTNLLVWRFLREPSLAYSLPGSHLFPRHRGCKQRTVLSRPRLDDLVPVQILLSKRPVRCVCFGNFCWWTFSLWNSKTFGLWKRTTCVNLLFASFVQPNRCSCKPCAFYIMWTKAALDWSLCISFDMLSFFSFFSKLRKSDHARTCIV